jgi:hypothetical protein
MLLLKCFHWTEAEMWSTPTVNFLARASDASKLYVNVDETVDRDGVPFGSLGDR